ncbi:zinc finger protein ZAT9-like [Wolffia australiana]
MEKHSCKLCHRRFSNGRALGGHMRSHVTPSKLHPRLHHHHDHHHHHHDHRPPSPSFSATASEEVAEVEGRSAPVPMEMNYGLRENPKKSFRLVDPEFSSSLVAVEMAINGGGSSVVLQDHESETESSKPPSLRRRSKRRRRSNGPEPEPEPEPEPVSSVSDTTPDEDVARCLMMLSRDVWASDSSPEKKPTAIAGPRTSRSKYRCDTCNKVFRSHQALGGHRASHKNFKACVPPPAEEEEVEAEAEAEEEGKGDYRFAENQIQEADSEVNFSQRTGSTDRKIHECAVCFRVFGSGQALGGHKRSHLVNPLSVRAATEATVTKKKSLLDLNLPPPAEEDGELSAVFDAEL